MLSNCGHDERGQYSGGQAGDQTGTEWELKPWYQYTGGWQYMIRHPDSAVGNMIAELAKEAANNNMIGYDQNERYTFWNQLKSSGYRPKNISVSCETDCSAGCAALVKAAGYLLGKPALQSVSADAYTGNIRQVLSAAGFDVYVESKYLTSDKYLRPGDFLLKEYNHICTNISTGSASVFECRYRVKAGGKWLPEVTNLEDFAGVKGKAITDVALRFTEGTYKYRVHTAKGWKNWIKKCDIDDPNKGVAGDGTPIDGIQIFLRSPKGDRCAQYRVANIGQNYYDWQIDTLKDEDMDGYAGDLKNQIDRLQITVK